MHTPAPDPPGPTGINELRSRAEALTEWKLALGRGVLPAPDAVEWPQEPFKSKFIVRPPVSCVEQATPDSLPGRGRPRCM